MPESALPHESLLTAVIDRIVPADQHPPASGFGALGYIVRQLSGDARGFAQAINDGLAGLDSLAYSRFGSPFADLAPAQQDDLLSEVETELWFLELVELTAEGVYADPGNGGNPGAASWAMLGYDHRLPEGPNGPPKREPKPLRRLFAGLTEYDVVIVGAGAGGGIAACVLAEAGKRVLLIDRGLERRYEDSGYRDHLRNHRYARYGHNTGPELEGNPRVFVDRHGAVHTVPPHHEFYHNNASAVGSGTLLYGAMAWRFHPDDFRMASRYGVPEGSSLVDWPFGYDELEPWYEKAEWEIGVAGDSRPRPHQGVRRRDYPMPPLPNYEAARVLRAGAEKLGLTTFTPPVLINTVHRHGRAPCIECGSCVGFPCPSDGKNGTQNTVVPRALATGLCDLVTGAMVERVDTDSRGKVIGVTFVQADAAGVPQRTSIRSRAVVLSCGAIETARLMLLSGSPVHPDGLGNEHDLVGRNLQGHYYPTAFGLFEEEVHVSRGPGVTIATSDYNHGNEGVIGGAMLADEFVMLPIIYWAHGWDPEVRRWGAEAKDFMRQFRHVKAVRGPVHEIPSPDCRVTLDPQVRDRHGLAVARLSGATHPETVRTTAHIQEKAHAWLRASGALRSWSKDPILRLSAGQHQAGTCRMGTDPVNSVTDAYGRVWGHDNLFIADASLHPTNGGFNPVLTIMAMAFRNATEIARTL